MLRKRRSPARRITGENARPRPARSARWQALLGGWLLLALLAACQGLAPRPTATPLPSATPSASPSPAPTFTASPSPSPSPSPTPTPAVLVGAGDIAICGQEGDDQTAALLEQIPGEIFAAGDNSNEEGTLRQYQQCFDPSWGRFKERLHPVPGNHDYETAGALDYFTYFGAAAGEPGLGYYSYDLGAWHVIALNSNCPWINGCGPDSPQAQWLLADLEAHPARCTLAYWHHARWSSGLAGSAFWLGDLWRILYEHGAEVVISGHDHDYERFARQNPEGELDPNGMRQFVVGTGGAGYYPFGETILPASEVRHSGTFGVLKLTLYPDRYDWEFIPVAGETFTDSGSEACR